MEESRAFQHTDPVLLPVLEDLRRREPIFHRPEFGQTSSDFERMMAADYWEVGASGRRYSRAFILEHLRINPPQAAKTLGWQTRDHALRQLGPFTFLLTYVLLQGARLTRRATIWERVEGGWQIVYHQGTIVEAEEDDIAPS